MQVHALENSMNFYKTEGHLSIPQTSISRNMKLKTSIMKNMRKYFRSDANYDFKSIFVDVKKFTAYVESILF